MKNTKGISGGRKNNGCILKAAGKSSFAKAMYARVIPQPGHGIPVSSLKTHGMPVIIISKTADKIIIVVFFITKSTPLILLRLLYNFSDEISSVIFAILK